MNIGAFLLPVPIILPVFPSSKNRGKVSTYIYDGAQHAFHNDTPATRYNEASAKLAWGRTMDFFKKKLR